MAQRFTIVGLGNPGPKYEKTRHNIGFWVIDELARRWNGENFKSERRALVSDVIIRGKRALLIKPQTYMNASGEAVRGLVDFYRVPVENVIVAYDELDLPLGTLRLRLKGSAGGQKGMKSVISHLNTPEVNRVRIGISRPPGRMDAAAYVLKPFAGDDAITARIAVDRAADAIETWLVEGIEKAMTKHNGSIEPVEE